MSSTELFNSDPKHTNSKLARLRDDFETLHAHKSLVATLCLQWQEFEDYFSAAREAVCALQRDLKVKEKELESREEELGSWQKQLESLKEELEIKQMQLDVYGEALQLKRKRLESLEKDAELRGKQLEFWQENLELKQNKLLLQLKRSTDNQFRVAELKDTVGTVSVETPLVDDEGAITCLSFVLSMDGKGLQRFLNDRFDEHILLHDKLYEALMKAKEPAKLVLEAIDGFFVPHLTKDGGEEYETGIVRNSCLLMLDQLFRIKPVITKPVRVEARGLANKWLKKIREEGESYLAVLSFLVLVITFSISSSFDRAVLERFMRLVQHDKRATQIGEEIGIPVNKGSKQEIFVQYAKVGCMCANMHVDLFKSHLCDHVLSSEMSTWAIRSAFNPEKLVFDVTLCLGTKASATCTREKYRKSCISLLEVLPSVSPKINESVRADALRFARSWKVRLDESTHKDPKYVHVLLQFMVAYKLTSSFSVDERIELYKTLFKVSNLYENQKLARLCHDLGLADKISDVVQTMIDGNQHIWAVKCICVLQLANDFSPTHLLKAYLDNIQMAADGKKNNGTYNEQLSAMEEEYTALQAVIKCIMDFKLDYEVPCSDLHKRSTTADAFIRPPPPQPPALILPSSTDDDDASRGTRC